MAGADVELGSGYPSSPVQSQHVFQVVKTDLRHGTPSWVLQQADRGFNMSNGDNLLFMTGLLSVGHTDRVDPHTRLNSEREFRWPTSAAPVVKEKVTQSSNEYGPPHPLGRPTRAQSLRAKKKPHAPRANTPPIEYTDYIHNYGKKQYTCLSERPVPETVRRPQLYPIHAPLAPAGESMHSFIVGSRYNKRNARSPAHLQMFDVYQPRSDDSDSFYSELYSKFRLTSGRMRKLASETEIVSRMKSVTPLPDDLRSSDPFPDRSHTSMSFRQPQRPSSRRLTSAPPTRVSHLQGVSIGVQQRSSTPLLVAAAQKGRLPEYYGLLKQETPKPETASVGTSTPHASRPSSGIMIGRPKMSGDCIICNSPEVWRTYVEQHACSPNAPQIEETTEIFETTPAVPITKEQVEAVPDDDAAAASNEIEKKPEEEEKEEINVRVFATEAPEDDDDEEPVVMDVEIIVRERPVGDVPLPSLSDLPPELVQPDELPPVSEDNQQTFSTRLTSSPEPGEIIPE